MEGDGGREQSQELVRVKEENGEPGAEHIKEEAEEKIEYSAESTALKEELCCPRSVESGEFSCANSTQYGVSEEAMLAGLYTNHEVKDELVLGPEYPHRPDVNLVVPGWAKVDVDSSISLVQESHTPKYTLWDCCVKLERDSHVDMLANMRTKTQDTDTNNYMDSDADDEMYTIIDCENELCDLCGESFTLKSDLLEHIMIHIYKPTKTEQEESVYGALENSFADVGACNLPDCSIRLERDPHVEALLISIKHTAEHKDITTAYADSEWGTKEGVYTRLEPHTKALANVRTNPLDVVEMESDADDEMYTIIDCENELCDLCGKTFTLKSDLIDHAMIHIHVPTSTILHQSRDTNGDQGQGSENTQHKTHVNIVTETYVCDACGRIYQDKYQLIRHIHDRHTPKPEILSLKKLNKTGKSIHSCYICGKHCTNKSHLETHYRTHTGERPYECDMCKRCFTSSSSLNRHKSVHIHLKQYSKPYQCELCDKGFSMRWNLKTHKRVHTGEKPYHCAVCDKYFTRSAHLTNHIKRIHTGEKPYCSEYASQTSERKALYSNTTLLPILN